MLADVPQELIDCLPPVVIAVAKAVLAPGFTYTRLMVPEQLDVINCGALVHYWWLRLAFCIKKSTDRLAPNCLLPFSFVPDQRAISVLKSTQKSLLQAAFGKPYVDPGS